MEEYITALAHEFSQNSNPTIAAQQKAYLRDQFEFYGLKTPTRRVVQKPFLDKNYLPPKSEITELVKTLWAKPQREYHYFAQELAHKYIRQLEKRDIVLFEYMVANQSWWDTVDFIAVKLMSAYFKKFPEQREAYVKKWISTNNIWLQRSALLFQLKWKAAIDTDLLIFVIKSLNGTNEFFINKAIGWVLREYSRTDPAWVINFVREVELHPLSKKEALRLLR